MNRVSHPRSVSESSKDNSDDQQQLSDLISVIYDAAIDPSRWEDAIVSIVQFVGGAAGGLFCKDVGVQHATVPHRFGFDVPLRVELFRQIYSSAEGHFLGDLEQPIATTDLMSFAALTQSELYRQWAEPRGLSILSARLSTGPRSAQLFSGSSATGEMGSSTSTRAGK